MKIKGPHIIIIIIIIFAVYMYATGKLQGMMPTK
jgi:hypothetical protein